MRGNCSTLLIKEWVARMVQRAITIGEIKRRRMASATKAGRRYTPSLCIAASIRPFIVRGDRPSSRAISLSVCPAATASRQNNSRSDKPWPSRPCQTPKLIVRLICVPWVRLWCKNELAKRYCQGPVVRFCGKTKAPLGAFEVNEKRLTRIPSLAPIYRILASALRCTPRLDARRG